MERRDKVNYYLDLAEMVSQRSTCLRKHYGAVIVNTMRLSRPAMWAPARTEKLFRYRSLHPRGASCAARRAVRVVPQCPCRGQCLISASRERMIGASLYLTGVDARTGGYVEKSSCCSMCKRMVINAGIEHVYIRDTKNEYRKVDVEDWIREDESLEGKFGY
mgnify:CR=1 FL=1